jgi:hypothetical protein
MTTIGRRRRRVSLVMEMSADQSSARPDARFQRDHAFAYMSTCPCILNDVRHEAYEEHSIEMPDSLQKTADVSAGP